MKTTRLSLLLTCVAMTLLSVAVHASEITLIKVEKPAKSKASSDPLISAAGSSGGSLPQIASRPERLAISSVCVGASPSVTQNRRNAIGGLIGMTVNTSPDHPEGWYVIPTNGWQWHHVIASSTFGMWRGKTGTNIADNLLTQRGNRMVISATGQYPVSAYQCRIASTLTNITSSTFAIGNDSQTRQELPFNVNFVGLNFGPNEVM